MWCKFPFHTFMNGDFCPWKPSFRHCIDTDSGHLAVTVWRISPPCRDCRMDLPIKLFTYFLLCKFLIHRGKNKQNFSLVRQTSFKPIFLLLEARKANEQICSEYSVISINFSFVTPIWYKHLPYLHLTIHVSDVVSTKVSKKMINTVFSHWSLPNFSEIFKEIAMRINGYVVEKPAEAQTSIWLASNLAWAPNSWSGGHEFESPGWIELSALKNDGWKTPQWWPQRDYAMSDM